MEPIARPIVLLVLARRTVELGKKFFFKKRVALVPFLRCIKEWSFYWYYETKCLIVDFYKISLILKNICDLCYHVLSIEAKYILSSLTVMYGSIKSNTKTVRS